jgi:hypothetical protein
LSSTPTDGGSYSNLRRRNIHELFRHDDDFPDDLAGDTTMTFG